MAAPRPNITLFTTCTALGPMLPRVCGYVFTTGEALCVVSVDEHATVTSRLEIPLHALRTLLEEQ